jgi:type I restriction enzyme S subunit
MTADTLPATWTEAELKDLVPLEGLFIDGDWVESKDQNPDGEVRLIQLADIGDGQFRDRSARFLTKDKAAELGCTFLETGDILVARMPDPLGRACIFPLAGRQKYVTVVDVCILRLLERAASQKFLTYAINSGGIRRQIAALESGTTRKRISRKNLERVRIPVAPLPEQHRIVAKIEELFSELDKGIENLRQTRAQLTAYRQALLKHAFEGKLTADWRKANPDKLESVSKLAARIQAEREAQYAKELRVWTQEVTDWEKHGRIGRRPARPSSIKAAKRIGDAEHSLLREIPPDWAWTRVEDLGAVQLGRQRSPKNESRNHPTKYIRAANITEDGLDLEDVKDMEFLPHELENYRLSKGDLVLSEASGSANQVGKPAIWNDELQDCCFQNTVIRHRPYLACIGPYLLTLYKLFYSSGLFARVSGGVGINHLSANKFAALPVPLAPVAEQERIVIEVERILTVCASLESDIDTNLQKAEALRQSILKKAFAGELVPQDPNDESASELLARIRSERAANSNVVPSGTPHPRTRGPQREHHSGSGRLHRGV